ncbi:MAG: Mpo1-like protein [Phycisphaerae bacterium]
MSNVAGEESFFMFENWKKRHQNKTSFTLHAIGIPLTILAIPAVVVGISKNENLFLVLAGGLFVIGYALQFVGHAIEGNDAGEVILIKKLLGKPYIGIVEPQRTQRAQRKD